MGLVGDEPALAGAAPRAEEWPGGCRACCPVLGQGRPVGLEDRPSHGSCWSRPRARCRPLPARPPFCGLSRAVRFHMCAVEAEFVRHRSRSRHALEHALPDPASGPPGEAVVDGGGRAIGRRHIAPAAAGLQDVRGMPEITRRSSTRGLPGSPCGRCGAMAAQA